MTRKCLFLIDVEPDFRHTSTESNWTGNLLALSHLKTLRAKLEQSIGRSVHFNWFFRFDPQIEHTWGRSDFVRQACPELLDQVEAWQDHRGMHCHLWKWDEGNQRWYNEFNDPAWEEHCFRTCYNGYKKTFGEAPISARMGERWMSERIPPLMRELGIRYDLGVESGIPAGPVFDDPYATSLLPDFTPCPQVPWNPKPGDYKSPGGPPDLTMIPTTASKPRWIRIYRWPYFERRQVVMNLVLHPSILIDTFRETTAPLVVVLRGADLAQPWALKNFLEATPALLALKDCEWVNVGQ
ncbi:hypothetical protein [Bryobacter aggregatus]|uniref:hypothetical protein n=1 Tax=Bryobacter aggregatus TaxID=360054 RepID=UPI0004E13BA7|nr:hypothetical protein [Bryobacter aggregatus]